MTRPHTKTLFTPVEIARTRAAPCVRARFAFHGLTLRLSMLASLALVACTSEPPTPTPVAEQPVGASESDQAQQQPAAQGAPKIACDEAVYDFGAVKLTDKIEHVFKIRNVGDADLKIERVQKT